ncbi:alkylated DNA repair protein alkB 8 [Parachaetomium inaequale]|uniref:Alkylated DNA repair protein alkB 8 n=1 Tax=Parachaetomium inaequale TaxID=2588326 RepID=A0AAN6P3T3_9PEZI|nr:alkylated DNA repair protein alkB 8 [Parachaetomium inaequale]
MAVLHEAPAPTIDPSNPNILRWDGIGLMLIRDFITAAEEAAMIEAFHARDPLKEGDMKPKKRISQHFGHHFDYTTFGASETHFTPVPLYITSFLPRLPIQSYLPDQFTVQYYPPGSGIPPHVDTHSMFGEALYSLSFGSAVPMQFRMSGPNDARKMRLPKRSAQTDNTESTTSLALSEQSHKPDEEQTPTWELLLPARSLLLMTGPSRYGYTHAIRPRKTDVINGSTVQRQGRYSITMRSIRRGIEIGCDCAFPGVCDARIREEMAGGRDEVVSVP